MINGKGLVGKHDSAWRKGCLVGSLQEVRPFGPDACKMKKSSAEAGLFFETWMPEQNLGDEWRQRSQQPRPRAGQPLTQLEPRSSKRRSNRRAAEVGPSILSPQRRGLGWIPAWRSRARFHLHAPHHAPVSMRSRTAAPVSRSPKPYRPASEADSPGQSESPLESGA